MPRRTFCTLDWVGQTLRGPLGRAQSMSEKSPAGLNREAAPIYGLRSVTTVLSRSPNSPRSSIRAWRTFATGSRAGRRYPATCIWHCMLSATRRHPDTNCLLPSCAGAGNRAGRANHRQAIRRPQSRSRAAHRCARRACTKSRSQTPRRTQKPPPRCPFRGPVAGGLCGRASPSQATNGDH